MITKSKVKRKHSCKSDFHTPHIDSGCLMCEYYNVCGSRQELTKNKQKKHCGAAGNGQKFRSRKKSYKTHTKTHAINFLGPKSVRV